MIVQGGEPWTILPKPGGWTPRRRVRPVPKGDSLTPDKQLPEIRRRRFVRSLLAWGRRNRRDFPWRHEADIFRVLVGEVLLQRSRSATVAGVYQSLFERWPTVEALATAPVRSIAVIIRPLGLTSRAANLREMARQVAEEGMPSSEAGFTRLPGVGRYAARATLSASGRRAPLVDGVSARVYRRYFSYGDSTEAELWRLVESVAPRRGGPEWNWAVLDLAASVCLPVRPLCRACPLRNSCAWASGTVSGVDGSIRDS
jgi:A/G-specific adenine glycosylase